MRKAKGKARIVSRDVLEAAARGKGTGDRKFDRKVRRQNKGDIEVLKDPGKFVWRADGKGAMNEITKAAIDFTARIGEIVNEEADIFWDVKPGKKGCNIIVKVRY